MSGLRRMGCPLGCEGALPHAQKLTAKEAGEPGAYRPRLHPASLVKEAAESRSQVRSVQRPFRLERLERLEDVAEREAPLDPRTALTAPWTMPAERDVMLGTERRIELLDGLTGEEADVVTDGTEDLEERIT